jgi:hypothetical protein
MKYAKYQRKLLNVYSSGLPFGLYTSKLVNFYKTKRKIFRICNQSFVHLSPYYSAKCVLTAADKWFRGELIKSTSILHTLPILQIYVVNVIDRCLSGCVPRNPGVPQNF